MNLKIIAYILFKFFIEFVTYKMCKFLDNLSSYNNNTNILQLK